MAYLSKNLLLVLGKSTKSKKSTGKYFPDLLMYWTNCGSRGPSVRYGHPHIFNNYYEGMDSAINTRVGAQILAENNVFSSTFTLLPLFRGADKE